MTSSADSSHLVPATLRFYRHALTLMRDSEIPFLLGGAYALNCYTGIIRHTKDLDLFLRKDDVHKALDLFRGAGYRTELAFAHWLGKAYHHTDFIDFIFNSGNGLCPVDDAWFEHAVDVETLGIPVRLVPVEEIIWQKMFIMERERFDGADVNHLVRACGPQLDWDRLLRRVDRHWRVLLSHLILFGFVYPDDAASIPRPVLDALMERLRHDSTGGMREMPLCRGPLLSRIQYVMDIEEWGHHDAREQPEGTLTEREAIVWTEAGLT